MAIEEAVDVLLDGGIVAIPTDTVYGLAADATNPAAVERLRQIKQRPEDKKIPVLVDSLKMFQQLTEGWPERLDVLIENFWPGPLTIVAPKRAAVLHGVTDGPTLGLRMPDNLVALGLISLLARPLAVSSANISGQPPATTAQEVRETFADDIELVLDSGATPGPAVSTVLSIAESPYCILRQGLVEEHELRSILEDLLK